MNNFKNYLQLNGSSEKTAILYTSLIDQLLQKINDDNINRDTINEFLLDVSKTRSTSTKNAYISALRSYFKFTNKSIELPKYSSRVSKIPQHISIDFFKTKVLPIVDIKYRDNKRVRAFIIFLFYTGLRLEEAINLKRDNFEIEKNRFKFVMSKNKKERIMFFTDDVKKIVLDYFKSENESKNAFNLEYDEVRYIFRNIGKDITEVNLHPHLFRHSFAINLLCNNVDLFSISKMLGHSNIRTTQTYLGLNLDELQSQYQKGYQNAL